MVSWISYTPGACRHRKYLLLGATVSLQAAERRGEHGRGEQLQPARRRRRGRHDLRQRRLRRQKATAPWLRAAAQAQSLIIVQLLNQLLDCVGADGHHDTVRHGH